MTCDPTPEGLREPLDASTRRDLRRAVVDLAGLAERRPRPVLHVGRPGGRELVLTLDAVEPADPGLRTDLAATLLTTWSSAQGRAATERDQPWVWLTRSGDLAVQDVDIAWLAAARRATEESGRGLTMVVVTRRGWRDPRSGLAHTWVRLRRTPEHGAPG